MKYIEETGEMARWLRVFVAFPKDLSLVVNTHDRQFTTTCNSRSGEPIPIASTGDLHTQVHIYMYTNMNIIKKKINVSKKGVEKSLMLIIKIAFDMLAPHLEKVK